MDERAEATTPARITVVAPDDELDKQRRKGFPRVLISEFQEDPDTGETVTLSRDDPPVHQRAQDPDRNIWWINAAAPLARLYLDVNKGYGFGSREWRIYHTERFIDVIVQIMLSTGPASEDELSPGGWIARWGERASDVQLAATKGLSAFLERGDLPKGT
jgi:hypothetical protein